MAVRQLTKFFGTYNINKFNKKVGVSNILLYLLLGPNGDVKNIDIEKLMDTDKIFETIKSFIDILDEEKLIALVCVGNAAITSAGNADCDEATACGIIDEYFRNNKDCSIVDAFITLINELEMDRHYFRGFGVNFAELSSSLIENMKESIKNIKLDQPVEPAKIYSFE